MPSVLVFGSNKNSRDKKIESVLSDKNLEVEENNPDLMYIKKKKGKKSIGIDQIRKAISFLNKKPFNHKNKAVVVDRADILTVQAQNALLKSLEEHPKHSHIILNAKTEDSLLDTVISRCKRNEVREIEASEKIDINIKDILSISKGKRLSKVDKISKKDDKEIYKILENWIKILRQDLDSKNSKKTAKNIEIINKVLDDISQTNLNTKLALETLFLSLE